MEVYARSRQSKETIIHLPLYITEYETNEEKTGEEETTDEEE